jgi:hypothetical protein
MTEKMFQDHVWTTRQATLGAGGTARIEEQGHAFEVVSPVQRGLRIQFGVRRAGTDETILGETSVEAFQGQLEVGDFDFLNFVWPTNVPAVYGIDTRPIQVRIYKKRVVVGTHQQSAMIAPRSRRIILKQANYSINAGATVRAYDETDITAALPGYDYGNPLTKYGEQKEFVDRPSWLEMFALNATPGAHPFDVFFYGADQSENIGAGPHSSTNLIPIYYFASSLIGAPTTYPLFAADHHAAGATTGVHSSGGNRQPIAMPTLPIVVELQSRAAIAITIRLFLAAVSL